MTYKEAIKKAYGVTYVRQSSLCRLLIDADGNQPCTSDNHNYYFYFPYNDSAGSKAILICADKYGGYAQIPNLFPEDGSVNYRVWISKSAPFEIIHFVCALAYGAGPITILGIPVADVVEYAFGFVGDKRTPQFNPSIDRYAANNVIRLIARRYGELSYAEMIGLIVKNYGVIVSDPHGSYWLYVRGENIPCDTLPFSVRKIVPNDEPETIYEPGIKWKSEYSLYKLVLTYYADAIFHYSATWLGNQHFDIFIPSINFGIEYQGEQHYKPVDFFGGERSFLDQKRLDNEKRKLSEENGVILIEWPYTVSIMPINLITIFFEKGIVSLPAPDCSRIPQLSECESIQGTGSKVVFEICQYTRAGNYLGSYGTYKEASKATGVSKKQIQKAVSGYIKTAGGFQWRRCANSEIKNDIESVNPAVQTNQNKHIYQVAVDGEVIAEFPSINSAVKQTGINRKSISSVLNGLQKTAGGYLWVYSNISSK